jgi:hypothetical protein
MISLLTKLALFTKVLDALAILVENKGRPRERELPEQSESSFAPTVASFMGGFA